MRAVRNTEVRILAVGCAVMLTSCGGGGGGESSPVTPPAAPVRVVTQSDSQIAALLYTDSDRTPSGFYSDPVPSGVTYAATFHLKNTDVAGQGEQHELCTDDWNDALSWSETAASSAPTYSDLVATDTNSRFYEFGRVPRGQSGGYLRARVYRCSYLDRTDVDLLSAGPSAGRLNRRPLSAQDLGELSEYLWLFTSYNNFGNVVLKSSGEQTTTRLDHTLHLARLQRAAINGGCDRVEVLAWTHSLEVASGTLQLSQRVLWSFGARQTTSAIELCTP